MQRREQFKRKYSKNKSISNQIRHIKEICNILLRIPKKPTTPYHINDVLKIPLRSKWYESILEYYNKMTRSTTFSAPFLRYSFPTETKILRPRISFRFKSTDSDNQYDLDSRKYEYG